MRVKRYVADSIQEAITRVKNDLGRNAIILHTKPFKEGGFLGFFCQRRFEVIAAVDENLNENTIPKKNVEKTIHQPVEPTGTMPIPASDQGRAFSAPIKSESVANLENSPVQPGVKTEPEFKPIQPKIGESRAISAGNQETAVANEPVLLKSLQEEIAEMKELIRQVASKPATVAQVDNIQERSKSLEFLRQYLQQLGFEGEVLDYILLQIPANLIENNASEEEFIMYCQQILATKLMFSEPIHIENQGEQQIIALIGPTGVGKTTTIAKLAANYNLFEGKKVGLITIDTYRIAAVEHLKTYGDIINLPVEVVYTPSDLNQSIQNLRDCDLILIDTAGRSPHNQAMMEELKKFLSHSEISSILLVISATTKYQDMLSIAENFTKIAYTHLVFTKLDETSSLGPIVSLALKTKRPISYLTTGQNVPDDLELAKPNKLINQLFKSNAYS